MKLTYCLVLATFCATSAFGLNGASTLVNRATGPKGLMNKNKPMVQAIDINGNRLNTVVSQINTILRVEGMLTKIWAHCCLVLYIGGDNQKRRKSLIRSSIVVDLFSILRKCTLAGLTNECHSGFSLRG